MLLTLITWINVTNLRPRFNRFAYGCCSELSLERSNLLIHIILNLITCYIVTNLWPHFSRFEYGIQTLLSVLNHDIRVSVLKLRINCYNWRIGRDIFFPEYKDKERRSTSIHFIFHYLHQNILRLSFLLNVFKC